MPNREEIVETARGWIGTPWKHQGRGERGIDCLGLVVVTAKALGLSEADEKTYSRRPDGGELIKRFKKEMKEISLNDIRAGDVILFADTSYPCHVAIVSLKHGELHIIHAHATRRQVLEERYAFEWPVKARKAFAFEGIA
jgi:cell wall-associated NlpC family hydrolase